jgi:hypothetical protein
MLAIHIVVCCPASRLIGKYSAYLGPFRSDVLSRSVHGPWQKACGPGGTVFLLVLASFLANASAISHATVLICNASCPFNFALKRSAHAAVAKTALACWAIDAKFAVVTIAILIIRVAGRRANHFFQLRRVLAGSSTTAVKIRIAFLIFFALHHLILHAFANPSIAIVGLALPVCSASFKRSLFGV